MGYLKGLRCKECGTRYPAGRDYVCLECFGPLEVEYDYQAIAASVSPLEISSRPGNLWRYRELLPLESEPISGLHSGFTPLIKARRLGRLLGTPHLYLKDDSANRPSLSYKDRVVSVALSRGVELGYSIFACASTGNLGNAVAAHCAATGLPALIFVPREIEAPKITGSLIFGSTVVALEGNYDDVNRLCCEIGDLYGWGFVNVNLRPYYTEGAKTFGYEIAEQLGWRLPDHLVLPTAGGTLLPRVAKGFRELVTLGWVEGRCRIHCAQAEGCAPVVRALQGGQTQIEPEKPNTLAKSIAIGNPGDGPYVLQEVRSSGGWGEVASEEEIVEAMELLASREGIFTEPAGGTTLAVTLKLLEQGRIGRDEVIVVGITGNGYKALDAVKGRCQIDAALRPNLRIFKEWYESRQAAVATQAASVAS